MTAPTAATDKLVERPWRCHHCNWSGPQPSLTEEKVVAADLSVTRPVRAVCPHCFTIIARSSN